VNSKGTRQRQSELAIAQLAFRLPGMITDELKAFEDELDDTGYDIDLRFLVRCLTAVATQQSRFRSLEWFLLSSIWQRYSGSSETAMDQDLRLVREDSPFEALERTLLLLCRRRELLADGINDVVDSFS